jgi:hypothetical protein
MTKEMITMHLRDVMEGMSDDALYDIKGRIIRNLAICLDFGGRDIDPSLIEGAKNSIYNEVAGWDRDMVCAFLLEQWLRYSVPATIANGMEFRCEMYFKDAGIAMKTPPCIYLRVMDFWNDD